MLGLGSLLGVSGTGLFGGSPRFSCELAGHPVIALEGKEGLENGNRLILPPAVLQELERLGAPTPMLFEVSDLEGQRRTHGGVLEFVAPPDVCYLPAWMLRQLHAEEGDVLRLQLRRLPKATFLRLQPSSVAFHRVFNPRALLENGLRNFVAVTVGDCFSVEYGGRQYGLEVLEVQPGDAACIVDADVEVEFATAKDAEVAAASPASPGHQASAALGASSSSSQRADGLYAGTGHRLGSSHSKGDVVVGVPEDVEEIDPMPWKRRIPGGVKWTSPPYGADAVRLVGMATPGWSAPGGSSSSTAASHLVNAAGSPLRLPAGDNDAIVAEPSPEQRAKALAAAEARQVEQAEEIERRRRLEEEEKQRQQRLALEEEARQRAREAERKAWARDVLGLGPDGKPKGQQRAKRSSRGARLLAACCRCFRGGSQARAPARRPRPPPARI